MQDKKVCGVCGTPGSLEARGVDFHAGTGFSSKTCDYAGTPPFADAEWANDENAMCLWCAGTGHPYGDESYGMCKCPKPLASDALLRTMARAGWELDFVDLDLTGSDPTVEIRAHRYDGLWFRAHVDRLGRATLERFQRKRSLGMAPNRKGRRPLVPLVDDTFLGRQKYEGARSMLRGMCSYLVDNALHPVALADIRSAWRALMQAPARLERPID